MNQIELILLITAVLFGTFALGWAMRWVYGRIMRSSTGSISEIDDLATRLHEAEEARDHALSYLQQREWELNSQITQLQAELDASMSALGDARRELAEYRDA